MRHRPSLCFIFNLLLLDVAFCREPVFRLEPRKTECGSGSCHDTRPGLINVHLVPHSHDDTGWLKTVDQYYYGAKQNIQRAGVQYIIESVIKELARDPEKRFIQVETGFFWRWWEDKGEYMRNITRVLVDSGQLVFTGGGWSMNDEAVTHYASIIDNMETGLNWLVDTLGECAVPTIAWQIDPFGHSKEQARLFAEMGFDGVFFARIDYEDKFQRKQDKTLQMWWEGGEASDNASTIFAGVFDDHYSNPKGFCWDILCTDEPINDDPRLEEYNLDNTLYNFEKYVKDRVKFYQDQEHIMFTMGDDFQYQNARMNFKNMDKLIKHMNERSEETGIHLLYSTPDCYLRAITSEDQTYPRKEDDFFPYGSGRNSYWTGYYTSRPSTKLQERLGARDLTVTRQLTVMSQEVAECEFSLHRAMGLMQHHDAVTGTEKQHVAEDYSYRLDKALQRCQDENVVKLLSKTNLPLSQLDLSLTDCPALNISQCEVSESAENFLVLVYNPLSRPVDHYVRIPVPQPNYKVFDHLGQEIETQFNSIPGYIRNIPVPPLGFSALYVTLSDKLSKVRTRKIVKEKPGKSGLAISPTISANMLYYKGSAYSGQPSGAYVFRPDQSGKHEVSSEPVFSQVTGPLVNESIVELSDWGVLTSRTYAERSETEVTWQVGPITGGKEVVLVYTTEVNNSGGDFYTDANGRQMVRRVVRVDTAEEEASNYYPVTTRLEIRGESGDLVSLVTDRSQGGTSLRTGELEMMIHRRCEHDDWFGVGEALEEEAFGAGLVVRGQHFLQSGESLNSARMMMQEHQWKLLNLFTKTTAFY